MEPETEPDLESTFLASMPAGRRILIGRIMWLVAILAATGGLVLAALNGGSMSFFLGGSQGAAFIVGTLGLLVVSHRPGNVVGWLLLWMGVIDGLGTFGLHYGIASTQAAEPLPFADVVGTVPYGVAVGGFFGLLITFFLLLFPDGRLPSPRWRPVAWVAAAGVLLMSAGLGLHVWQAGPEAVIAQLGREGLETEGTAAFLNNLGHLLVFLVFPLAVASLFVRRRRAGTIERQQLKLFAYGAVVFLSSVVSSAVMPEPYALYYEMAAAIFLFGAVAVAIVRYRLYDIDRLVSRSVTYAVVTALLVGLYLISVFLLHRVLPAENDLAVAASTLAAAAAFNPLRRRVQRFVDSRFNRSRYDAQRTVEHFSRHIREATDVASLGDQLQGTTASVMEPAHLSLWLREAR